MSVTQFAFVSLVVLHPEKFGMKRATKEELEGISRGVWFSLANHSSS